MRGGEDDYWSSCGCCGAKFSKAVAGASRRGEVTAQMLLAGAQRVKRTPGPALLPLLLRATQKE
jgi:hypothetical protein